MKDMKKFLRVVSKKHDLVNIHLEDPREKELLKGGLIKFRDAETQEIRYLDTSNKTVQNHFEQKLKEREFFQDNLFKKSRVDTIKINTSTSYVRPLIDFFKLREKRW